jgi:hypothetical protein
MPTQNAKESAQQIAQQTGQAAGQVHGAGTSGLNSIANKEEEVAAGELIRSGSVHDGALVRGNNKRTYDEYLEAGLAGIRKAQAHSDAMLGISQQVAQSGVTASNRANVNAGTLDHLANLGGLRTQAVAADQQLESASEAAGEGPAQQTNAISIAQLAAQMNVLAGQVAALVDSQE